MNNDDKEFWPNTSIVKIRREYLNNKLRLETHYDQGGDLHRDDGGPALILYNVKGAISHESWYKHGLFLNKKTHHAQYVVVSEFLRSTLRLTLNTRDQFIERLRLWDEL